MNSEVRMAHEISRQFADEPPEHAVETLVSHVRKFWAPAMISTLLAEADRGAELDPIVAQAVDRLR
jgi:formate dehydrogenase subunit delta